MKKFQHILSIVSVLVSLILIFTAGFMIYEENDRMYAFIALLGVLIFIVGFIVDNPSRIVKFYVAISFCYNAYMYEYTSKDCNSKKLIRRSKCHRVKNRYSTYRELFHAILKEYSELHGNKRNTIFF